MATDWNEALQRRQARLALTAELAEYIRVIEPGWPLPVDMEFLELDDDFQDALIDAIEQSDSGDLARTMMALLENVIGYSDGQDQPE